MAKELTVEEIDEKLLELGEKRDSIHTEMDELTKARDAKLASDTWSEKIDAMTDEEKANLAKLLTQTVAASGIASKEGVNGQDNSDED